MFHQCEPLNKVYVAYLPPHHHHLVPLAYSIISRNRSTTRFCVRVLRRVYFFKSRPASNQDQGVLPDMMTVTHQSRSTISRSLHELDAKSQEMTCCYVLQVSYCTLSSLSILTIHIWFFVPTSTHRRPDPLETSEFQKIRHRASSASRETSEFQKIRHRAAPAARREGSDSNPKT
jgi:hypothetical protein